MMDGELTLEQLDGHGEALPWSFTTTRALADLEPSRAAELLAAADAARFFTRPEPALDSARHDYSFRVAITQGTCSRELVIGRPNADPELERVASAVRACLDTRKAVSLHRHVGRGARGVPGGAT